MAKFDIFMIKENYLNKSVINEHVCLRGIKFEETDETVVIPSTFNGQPITHFGYEQYFDPAHEDWHDWHHPTAYGCDWVPDKYGMCYANTIVVPDHVKKVIIPASIKDIQREILKAKPGVLEFDGESDNYVINGGKIDYRRD